MREPDTHIGGPQRSFPSTHWSMILEKDPALTEDERRSRAGALLQQYWKPIYWHIRKMWSKPDQDAKDLTQDFCAHILESDLFGRARKEKGTFRAFLKTALRNFLASAEESAGRLKRGGGATLFRVEGPGPENWEPRSDDRSPDQVFDAEWAKCVLLQAARTVEQELARAGKAVLFEAYRRLVLETGPEKISYREVAQGLGISESDVKNYRYEVTRRMKRALREVLSDQVSSAEELETEFAILFEPPR